MGVMGCADIARRRMLPAMAASTDIEITAIASRDAGRAEELARRYGGRPVHGYTRLLERDDVDAVYIPLPAALHAEWVEAGLRSGRHVLAEKPLTTDATRTRQLWSLAAARGLALMENVMFVHHRQHAAVRRLLTEGAIGELRAFHAAFAIPRLPDHDIRYRAELGGGALWDVGVYPVRAAMHYLGDGLDVIGAMLVTVPRWRVHTSGAALLHTPSGISAHLTFGLDHAYRSALELWGSTGRLVLDRAFTPPADHRPVLRIERSGGTEEVWLEPDDQVANTLTTFVTAVRVGAAPDEVCLYQASLLDGVRARAGTRAQAGTTV
jgi:predicted dehydrogenase